MAATVELVAFARAVSRLLGWAYFLSWSGSFYPQPVSNWRRRSTLGLAIDFPTLNVLGFVSYAISTGAFLYSPTIRSQYAFRHPESPETTVRFNDFLFAAHGAVMCIVIYSQFFPSVWGFKVDARQRASLAVLGIFWGCIVGILVTLCTVQLRGRDGGYDAHGWAWLDVIYALGYVKLITVFIKYIPQVYVNFKRKSTIGWSIYPMLMDFFGGIASLAQLVIDSSLQNDWSGIVGNPVKFGLGNITIAFDIIFIYQHYFLYRHSDQSLEEEDEWEAERQRLLSQPVY
ncbi:L-cystine transporter-like protein [Lophiostoma macrostomum CBS 122681]|uniref:L-cystine transporter-like protein n=1 Tax=Lophiostoma macrostomum CBS 122681 TaxID=1314788 RepID=A0A6A6T7W8_9PLEO|nr:L-cystine transporter-like protein [Lophiostoma macrostomum CBS 122681]